MNINQIADRAVEIYENSSCGILEAIEKAKKEVPLIVEMNEKESMGWFFRELKMII